MCGIAGFVHFDGRPACGELLCAMTRLLEHRGPDDEGMVLEGEAGLGHRRLRIIDLSGGRQPMRSHDGRWLMVYNGELFNYVELRDELQAAGAVFRTHSDTEVLLELLARFGPQSLSRCNGQFAFALYDTSARRLVLGRDAMGEKPLYYARFGMSLVFGSELKAIMRFAHGCGVPLALSAQALTAYLSLNYVPFEWTMIAGISKLPPGSWLEADQRGDAVHHYEPAAGAAVPWADETAEARFDELLHDAVRLRLRSDVPVGLFLSGGIDSSTVAAAVAGLSANEYSGGKTTAFVAQIAQPGFSEAPYAVAVCRALGLPYQQVEVDPQREDLPRLLERLVYYADEPLADSSAFAVFLLCRAVAQQVKVVLSGDGGDELFGGYLTYRATMLARRLPARMRTLIAAAAPLTARLPCGAVKVGLFEKLARFARGAALPPGQAHFAWNGMFDAAEKQRLLRPELLTAAREHHTFAQLAAAFGVDPEEPTLDQLLAADIKGYLANDILAKVDRMSMAHGLEVRPVFMDPRLVAFARSAPETQKIHGRETKVLLRRYLRRKLPQINFSRPKQGFSIPIHAWFRTELRDFAGDLFHSSAAGELYRPDYLRELWQAHLTGKRHLGFELWGVLVSLLWLRKLQAV